MRIVFPCGSSLPPSRHPADHLSALGIHHSDSGTHQFPFVATPATLCR